MHLFANGDNAESKVDLCTTTHTTTHCESSALLREHAGSLEKVREDQNSTFLAIPVFEMLFLIESLFMCSLPTPQDFTFPT